MWDSCVMTWKTLLDLFKKDYKLFVYRNGDWFFKCGENILYDIKIFLELNNNMIKDGDIIFLNHIQNGMKFIKQEELQWNPIKKNIILF